MSNANVNLSITKSRLTDEQCDEFRRHPGSFNDMVRHIYERGQQSVIAEVARQERERLAESVTTWLPNQPPSVRYTVRSAIRAKE